jgi:molybdopterin-guanine dinucleotide biosynthesis protein A
MKVKQVLGVVLAGGLSRRMEGGDKSFKRLSGKSLLAHVLERFHPQVPELIINTNGDPTEFLSFGRPVVADVFTGFAGPLAGILTGMSWAKANCPEVSHILTAPCDGPFLPLDYRQKMEAGLKSENADIAMASSRGRSHPVAGLWPVALYDELERAIEGGVRKVDIWTAGYKVAIVDFPMNGDIDPFFNANRPDDLKKAENLIERNGFQ